MLQRAASNAYSWWWASHIRTKQSKWLEQNLQDMEEKVKEVLKLIEEDGDSFAKRAEMYYKKRPELISFVEESYRAYRALAERYDHISTELQNANTTIASVFPEQVQFAMDEEDEAGSPKIQKKSHDGPKSNVPKVPNIPTKDLKGLLTLSMKRMKPKRGTKVGTTTAAKSGLSKTEALKEIDALQKGILALQTEKEFVKVSSESSIAKYWEIEKQIAEMQEKICKLQDEFSIGAVIEDDEARNLMAAAALKSCQETLAQLQERQEGSTEEARVEHQRIKDARGKLEILKDKFLQNQTDQENPFDKYESGEEGGKPNSLNKEVDPAVQERELSSLREKIKEQFEVGSSTSLTVAEMADKVDELVTKVVSLETAVSSQTALIRRLRTETDDLQEQIRSLEDERATLIYGKNDLSSKLREMKEKLHGIQDLNQNIKDQNNNLQTHFTQAHCNLDHLTNKLHSVMPDEKLEVKYLLQKGGLAMEIKSQNATELGDAANSSDGCVKPQTARTDKEFEVTKSMQKNKGSLPEIRVQKEFKEQENELNLGNDFSRAKNAETEVGEDKKEKASSGSVKEQAEEDKPNWDKGDSSQTIDNHLIAELHKLETDQEDEPNWQQLFSNGMEDREKILVEKYAKVLQNFQEIKKKLSESEKKNGDSHFETNVHLRELESANAKKDEEIQSLHQKLTVLQASLVKNKNLKENIDFDNQQSSNLLDDQTVEQIERPEAPTVRKEESTVTEPPNSKPIEEDDEGDVKVILIDQAHAASAIEEKFRMSIDELLEQNLDFWLRFSTSFHQIQKFQTGIQDLQAEISKINEKIEEKDEGSSSPEPSLKSDARPIYKHLREIQTELAVWVEQSVVLKDELQCRFSSLCNIQEEITKALKAGSEDEGNKFTSYQAAKFQGEVLNMQQENNKVADELQAGLDHVTGLQLEIEKTLAKLNEEFKLSGSKNHSHSPLRHSTSRTRVPLRSFIFGTKPKKQKPSLFACMNPALNRKYNNLRAGLPTSLKSSSRRRNS